MSKIQVSTELMKNQKAASVLPAQSLFEALQQANGNTIFFSIGDNKVFNLTLEKSGTKTGWEAIDISSELSVFHGNKVIAAQTFAVTQNYENGNITIALVVRADGETSDTLYVLSSLSNAPDASWLNSSTARNWLARPYDDPQHPLDSVSIAYIYLTPTQKESSDTQLVAEIPSTTTGYLQNYTVNLSGNNAWTVLQTAENFDAVLGQVIGQPTASYYAGLYQLTSLNGGLTIDFIPMQSMFGPPTIIKMKAPDGATKLATLTVDDQNHTNLFIAAKDGLYLFTPDKQLNFGEAMKVVDNAIFAGTQKLYAHQSSNDTIVWGLNQKGDVFYSRCAKGQEGVTTAWSYPIPILSGVEQLASFLNQDSANSVIFAHTQGQELIQLSQDSQTTSWQQRNILLPSPNVNDVVEYNTFSTHIQLTGDDNLPLSEATLSIISTSQCSVYVNNVYHILSPDIPIDITTDVTGIITVIQETQGLVAVCYHLELKADNTKIDVNPMTKLVDIVSGVKNGDDLANVSVTNADGSTQKLIPQGTSKQDVDSTAPALQQFVNISAQMPQDGSLKSVSSPQTSAVRKTSPMSFVVSPDTIWGMSFSSDRVQYYEGATAMSHFGLQLNSSTSLMGVSSPTIQLNDIGNTIETTAGDFFDWLKHAYKDVTKFFVNVGDNVYYFFIELGGQLYRFVLDCVHDVVNAIEFVFNKIKVFIEDLIKWLGFLFQWDDIVRTHKVIKNIIKQYIVNCVQQIDTYKTNIAGAFDDVEERLKEWAGLESTPGNLSEISASNNKMLGQNDPQSHWGIYHLNNNADSASANITATTGTSSQLEELMQELSKAIQAEDDTFQNAFNTLQSQILHLIQNLSVGEIIKRIIAVLGDLLIESVKNIVITSIEVMEILVEGVLTVLDTPIDIPVISSVYKEIADDELSLLDAVCLVVAIPSTLVYKIAYNNAPYPDNSFTDRLINAKNWQELQQIFNEPNLRAATTDNQAFLLASDTAAAPAKALELQTIDESEQNTMVTTTIIILEFFGYFSSMCFMCLTTIKAKTNPPTAVLNGLHTACFFTTTGFSITASLITSSEQTWTRVVAETVYGLTGVQKVLDTFTYNGTVVMIIWKNITKELDFVLGVAGFVPTIGILFYKRDTKTITSTIANSFWNAQRMTTPWANIDEILILKLIEIGFFGIGELVLGLED
ncbi:hypothetical protein [Nostoc sp.]|uniref:hypothetical protein n=1 Tax=Nostoc sp. TaxID=1180 RepID=UPI002FF92AAB